MPDKMQDLERAFRRGAPEYSLAPMWYWNDELHEDEIARQLRAMKAAHVIEPMIFPMAGMTPAFLSQGYFEAFEFSVREAKRLGMKLWIYDDYCWPGGCAGGLVQERHPEHRMTHLHFHTHDVPRTGSRQVHLDLPPGRLVAARAVRAGSRRQVDITDRAEPEVLDWKAPAGAWQIQVAVVAPMRRVLDACSVGRWTNDAPGYVDLMNPAAVRAFIDYVYEGHFRVASEAFGDTVVGFYNDEPWIWGENRGDPAPPRHDLVVNGEEHPVMGSLAPPPDPRMGVFVRSLPWTRGLFGLFRERYGYDLRPHIFELFGGPEADRRVCYHYYRLAADRFSEAYFRQLGQWCAEHKVLLSGHTSEGPHSGDYYNQIGAMQVPGMDNLGGWKSALSGLRILPKTVSSVARMKGAARNSCEVFGITDWGFSLAEKVRNTDILAVQGINMQVPIDYAYSFRSFRKHTANPPGFYQAANWNHQRAFSDHAARLCQAAAAGRSDVNAAVLYPSSAELSNAVQDMGQSRKNLEAAKRLYENLEAVQIEADVLYEAGLPEAKLRGGRLSYPGASYRTVLVPPCNALKADTLARLGRFAKAGGRVVVFLRLARIDPEGESLVSAWRKHLGLSTAVERFQNVRRTALGKGEVVFLPDDLRELIFSATVASGEVEALFDGTESLFLLDRTYPQEIAIDLGEPRDLVRLVARMEPIKADVPYDYEVLVSDDGKKWRTAAAIEARKGRTHTVDLKRAQGRWVRWRITEGADRFLGLAALDLVYRDDQGREVAWRPPQRRPRSFLAELLPDAQAPLRFTEPDESLAEHVWVQTRREGRARIVTVMNPTERERHLVGRARKRSSVEHWDPDTGAVRTAKRAGEDEAFAVSFAPWQTRVFVTGRDRARAARSESLSLRRRTVRKLSAPYTFRIERENALPLAACDLQMRDPVRPQVWHDCEGGKIPPALRLVPRIEFRCTVQMDHLTGKERILYENGVVDDLAVNGRPVRAQARSDDYYDAFGLSVDVGRLLKTGRNQVTGTYAPEIYERTGVAASYRYPRLQPTLDAFLLGAFAVRGDRVVAPPKRLKAGAWERQGYPYYAGTGVYRVDLDWDGGPQTVWLEVDVARAALAVRVNGRDAGERITDPYLVDLTGKLRKGRNTVELRVTSTLGPLLRAAAGSSLGPKRTTYETGLHAARLVTPVDSSGA